MLTSPCKQFILLVGLVLMVASENSAFLIYNLSADYMIQGKVIKTKNGQMLKTKNLSFI